MILIYVMSEEVGRVWTTVNNLVIKGNVYTFDTEFDKGNRLETTAEILVLEDGVDYHNKTIEELRFIQIPKDNFRQKTDSELLLEAQEKIKELEKELKEQKEMNLDFQNATYGTLDYLFSKQN